MRLLPPLLASRDGSSITEFAILAPVMILLIAGAIEIGRIAMVRSSLEAAVGTAARAAMVDLDVSEDARDEALRKRIRDHLGGFRTFEDREIEIETQVYRDFGSAYPEGYEDENENGIYDGPTPDFPGEAFDDRNRNGVRDVATQKEGKLGAEGDVVAYTAHMPIARAFEFLPFEWYNGGPIILSSTVVLRNEPVKR